jgi:hypothetical protein
VIRFKRRLTEVYPLLGETNMTTATLTKPGRAKKPPAKQAQRSKRTKELTELGFTRYRLEDILHFFTTTDEIPLTDFGPPQGKELW